MPLPLNRANARLGWKAMNGKKRKYYRLCDDLQAAGMIPAPKQELHETSITVHFRLWQLMDQSNLMARMKWVEDWLVSRGYLEDDSPHLLTYTAVPTQEVSRKDMGVDITLEPTHG